MRWLIAAWCIFPTLLLCAWLALRGSVERRFVGLQITGTFVIVLMTLLAVAQGRDAYLDLPLALGLLSFGSGLMFVRFLEKRL